METWNYLDGREYLYKVARGMPPVIIAVAITGGVAGKEVNPNIPETPEEQADSTYDAYKAGASVVHLHARDPKTSYANPTPNPEYYYKINKLVRERCPDIIICDSCGIGVDAPRAEALKPLEAKPEMASLNCGPLILRGKLLKRNPPLSGRDEDVDMSKLCMPVTFAETELLAQAMREKGVKPELEVYNTQMLNVVYNLINKGLLDKPYWFTLIFADAIAQAATIMNFTAMLAGLPQDSLFQGIGVGPAQYPTITMSIIAGGNVRVGFEDNIFYKRGELLKNSADAVKKAARIANELDREVATPAQAREMLGLSQTPTSY
ncbi:3-keto-5-aminohexanoate cleavage protein [Chloroflexota bacterium]